MSFTIDFLDDGRVLEWETTVDGAIATEREDYSPRFYITYTRRERRGLSVDSRSTRVKRWG